MASRREASMHRPASLREEGRRHWLRTQAIFFFFFFFLLVASAGCLRSDQMVASLHPELAGSELLLRAAQPAAAHIAPKTSRTRSCQSRLAVLKVALQSSVAAAMTSIPDSRPRTGPLIGDFAGQFTFLPSCSHQSLSMQRRSYLLLYAIACPVLNASR